MRILAHMVVKDEADSYLQSCLKWNSRWWDAVSFYDDQSSDETASMCGSYGHVDRRPDDVPDFRSDEGAFRQAAWRSMEERLDPEEGDWVFVIDADEFLVGTIRRNNPHDGLMLLSKSAESTGADSVPILVPEVWEHLYHPMVRVDGYWHGNRNERFVRYAPGEVFKEGMGCGSVPQAKRKEFKNISAVALLHYGYTVPGAIQRKHELYSKNLGRHSKKHVDSIVATPELSEWQGEVPKLWFGHREVEEI